MPPCCQVPGRIDQHRCGHVSVILNYKRTYGEEDPLQHLAVVVRVAVPVEREEVVFVVVLLQVEHDRCGLEYDEVVARAVDKCRDASVRVQLEEPRFLLSVLPNVNCDIAGTASQHVPPLSNYMLAIDDTHSY